MSAVIGGLIAALVVAYVSRRAASSGVPGQLRHGWVLRALGWLTAAAAVGLIYVVLFTDHQGQYAPLTALIVFFGLSSVALLLETYGTYGTFDAERIVFRSIWSGKKRQLWSDLVSAKFAPNLGWYTLTFKDGTRIRLSTIISGHGEALAEIKRRGVRLTDS